MRKTKKLIKNKESTVFQNGLADAVGYNNIMGQPQYTPGTAPLSSIDTLTQNNRWYMLSNIRQLLNEVYVEHGLVSTIVDVPVEDALRGGVTIKSKQLSEEEINELQVTLEREGDYEITGQAGKYNRLFGGAGIIICTDALSFELPFSFDEIKEDTKLKLKAVDMWELFYDRQEIEDYSLMFDDSKYEFYNYYGKKVHKSRVIKLKGLEAPSLIRSKLRGWGYSEVEKMVRSINQYLKSTNLAFELLDELKLDVYSFKNLNTTLMSNGGNAQVAQRVSIANWQKNYQNALVLDSEDKYEAKQITFAGLAEVQAGIREQVCSDLRMPMTKVFGISPGGLNSTGESDLENYNTMIEGSVRNKLKVPLLKIIEIRCKKMFGYVPSDLQIEFKSLRVLTDEMNEVVKNHKFSRLFQSRQSGFITDFEFREGCNKSDLLEIKLDLDQVLDVEPKPQDPKEETKEIKVNEEGYESLEYMIHAYSADKGAEKDPRPDELIKNPGKVDESKWQKAKDAAQKAFGAPTNWKFVSWFYKKIGGVFHEIKK